MTEAQATTVAWTRPSGTLGELVSAAGKRVEFLRARARELERDAAGAAAPIAFAPALLGDRVKVIAELKRRSPSRGAISDALDAPSRARAYERGGAAAISVLTEPDRFGGSLDDLRAVRAAVALPVLRKDFIVHPLQLLEARGAGASAVLLIARALPPAVFAQLAASARSLGLDVLLEVRDERELVQALSVDGGVIGVNNRNLETLALDEAVTARLMPLVPPSRLVVYESGIRDRAGVERAAAAGADAVLVGSALSAAADGTAAVAALAGVGRHARG